MHASSLNVHAIRVAFDAALAEKLSEVLISLLDNPLSGISHGVVVPLESALSSVAPVVVRANKVFDLLSAAFALSQNLNPALFGARLVDALVVINSDAHDEVLLAANVIEAALDALVRGLLAVSGR